MNTESPKTIVHCFEEAGLGKAPFRFVGCKSYAGNGETRIVDQRGGVTTSTTPGTSCAFCGTYIVEAYVIESADRKRFNVGCDCVYKTGDFGLVNLVKKAANKLHTEKRHIREAAKIAQLMAEIEANKEALSALPGMNDWAVKHDKNAYDHALEMASYSGNAGKLKWLKMALDLLK